MRTILIAALLGALVALAAGCSWPSPDQREAPASTQPSAASGQTEYLEYESWHTKPARTAQDTSILADGASVWQMGAVALMTLIEGIDPTVLGLGVLAADVGKHAIGRTSDTEVIRKKIRIPVTRASGLAMQDLPDGGTLILRMPDGAAPTAAVPPAAPAADNAWWLDAITPKPLDHLADDATAPTIRPR